MYNYGQCKKCGEDWYCITIDDLRAEMEMHKLLYHSGKILIEEIIHGI